MGVPALVATDLDGTLLRSDSSLSTRTADALRRAAERGVEIVLVTARPPRSVDRLVGSLDIPVHAICCNGAIRYDPITHQTVDALYIEHAVVQQIVDTMKAIAPRAGFAVETGNYMASDAQFRVGHPSDSPRNFELTAQLVDGTQPAVKVLAWEGGRDIFELLEAAGHRLRGTAEVTHSGTGGTIEFSGYGVTKQHALSAYCEKRDIESDQVAAFGDMPNDLSFLGWAGRSFAVANAHRSVLEAVDQVIDSNDQDGVASAIEDLLSGRR